MQRLRMYFNLLVFYFFGGNLYAKLIGVKVGKNCRIYTKHFGSEPYLIEIGDNVTITQTVRFVNHDGAAWLVSDEHGRRHRYGRISIGSNVFIGLNVVIMPGVNVGDNCIIAAGSVVTKNVEANSIVAGVPARKKSDFFLYKKRVLLEYVSNDYFIRQGGFSKKIIAAVCDKKINEEE